MTSGISDTVLALRGVRLVRDGGSILIDIDWTVCRHERWIVLGPNGSGKTTLCQVASMYLHPSAGSVEVLGELLGRTDVRTLRTRIGFASTRLAEMLRADLRAVDIVVTAKHGALAPWWHTYTAADRARAQSLLVRFGCALLADRRFGSLSAGERKRVELARALMADPGILLLDEPTAGLDLGGREALVSSLAALAADPVAPPIVLVTHHVDEIPPGFTHVLMLGKGRVLHAGPIATTLTDSSLSECFGLALQVKRRNGRWQAWAE